MATNIDTELTETERKVLDLISGSARRVSVITVREIQATLDYASPSSPHRALMALVRKGKIKLIKRGVYEVL